MVKVGLVCASAGSPLLKDVQNPPIVTRPTDNPVFISGAILPRYATRWRMAAGRDWPFGRLFLFGEAALGLARFRRLRFDRMAGGRYEISRTALG